MKSLFNKYIWLQLILSILLLFGGTIIIIFAINGKEGILADVLNIVGAVILFLFGAFAILTSLIFETRKYVSSGLLYGSACIALGVFLCLKKLILLDYLVYLLAIFFIVVGAIELIKAIIFTVKKEPVPVIVISYLVAALFIAGGILALIFNDKFKTAFCIVAGVLLFVAGVFELIFGIRAMIEQNKEGNKKGNKKSRKKEKDDARQAEVKEIDYTTNGGEEQKKTDN